ncbi:MAG: Two-component hybrid sensor and regulator [Candidatus Eremiobacteraeota bacterium]|nr:Two-component hybrid sensor and regulator [Candidatus Eremiobacteraeota bacterium]
MSPEVSENALLDSLHVREEFLRQILASTEDCIKILDLDARLEFMSENGMRALAIPDFELVRDADWLAFWHGDDRVAAEAAVAAARAGEPGQFEGYFETLAGEPKWFHVVVSPMAGAAGKPERLLAVSRDITAARRDRALIEKNAALYRGLAEAVPAIVFSADASGSVDYVNRRFADYTGLTFDESLGLTWQRLVHPDDAVAAVASWHASVREARAHDATFRMRRADGVYRWHVVRAVPIEDATGAVERWFGTGFDVDEGTRNAERLALLVGAGNAFSSSLDYETTLSNVARLAVRAIATLCFVDLIAADGSIQRVAWAHADDASSKRVAALSRFSPPPRNAAHPAARAIAQRTPVVIANLSDAELRDAAIDDEHYALVRELGVTSVISVPLIASGEVLGALTMCLAREDGRVYDASDVTLCEDLAKRAAVAIEHAQRYTREHQVAAVLQAAALPRSLPDVAGMAFDAVYLPGKSEAEIGGDWYDAFTLAGGRIVISIGDVVGSGLRAAVTMTKIREAIRTAALANPDPAAILALADLALKLDDAEMMATAMIGVLDPVARTLTCAAAGHPGPLMYVPGAGISEPFLDRALPLGLRTGEPMASHTIALPAGAFLAFFTDGLIESTRDACEGERRVHAALADPAVRAARNPAAAIREAVLFDGARDDVAILTLSLEPD